MKFVLKGFFVFFVLSVSAQNNKNYWQQKVDYKMDINMNVETHQYKGSQELTYTNNSPDTLKRVFYHLYFNAFQPGSEMDVRSLTIIDPDSRVGDRISKLTPSEIGYIKPKKLAQDGKDLKYKVVGTVLVVTLNTPILPKTSTVFNMNWEAQVPIQIRRSGRDNAEGVAYSMTQWYPKMAEYDFEGWHADPYIAREFYGVWGDFDVNITLDENYILGGSGYLQNGDKNGLGKKSKHHTRTWHFNAPKVHDFTWVADKDFLHDSYQGPNGVTLNFYYKNNPEIIENWKQLQPKTADLMAYYNANIGNYPYKQYSVIQGGDGGMEYAMCTLITGNRKLGSLIGVTAHEMAHSWFQFLLATNESEHEWMDEGFTSYISDRAMNEVMDENKTNPFKGSFRNYTYLAISGKEQPQTTHADRYNTNANYGIAAYSKGEVFLAQLGYIIGQDNLQKTLKKYFEDFKFKHPIPNDFKRTAEKVSGLQLDWYLNEWTQTTHTIDYAVKAINNTEIILENKAFMPMPIDLKVTYTDSSTENFYIPLRMLLGHKPTTATVINDWSWVQPTYTFTASKAVRSVEIDPSGLMADINRSNNVFEIIKD